MMGASLAVRVMVVGFAFPMVASSQGPPETRPEWVVNAATLSGPPRIGFYFGLGSIVTIFGKDLAASSALATCFPLPTQLAGTSVLIGGDVMDRLLYVSPTQINLVLPPSIRPFGGLGSILVNTPTGSVRFGDLSGGAVSPGLFTADGTGCGLPALWSYRLGRYLGGLDSTQPGEILTVYGTGFGPPHAAYGDAAPADPPLEADPRYRYDLVFADGLSLEVKKSEVLWQRQGARNGGRGPTELPRSGRRS